MKNITYTILAGITSVLLLFSCTPEENIITGSNASILSCIVESNGINFEASIIDDQIMVDIPRNSELDKLGVTIELSEGASMHPQTDEVEDWSKPVSFRVESANGDYNRSYTMTVTIVKDNFFDSFVAIGNNSALSKFAENEYTQLGGLYIYDDNTGDDISSISVLNKVKNIRTDLKIIHDKIESVELESLQSIGNIDLQSVSITSVNFPALEDVSGRFRIGNDDSGPLPPENLTLTQVNLPMLKTIGKSFVLFLCGALEEVNTPQLSSVGEDYILFGGQFKDLSMMSNLKTVEGVVDIAGNLESFNGFGLQHIGIRLKLATGNVPSLEPLSTLESVDILDLVGSEKITSLKGIENIQANTIQLQNFHGITTTHFLPIYNGISYVNLRGFNALESLDGFEELSDIGTLYLVGCPSLMNLGALSNITSIENLALGYFDNIESLPQLSVSKIPGKLTISKMAKLQDISGLASIKEVGSLQLDNLLTLPSLEGLESLEKITNGSLIIGNNKMIKNLDPLSGLQELNMPTQMDLFRITMNDELDDFCAVSSLLIDYWNDPSGKFPKVEITRNKYNPTYEQLTDGECSL